MVQGDAFHPGLLAGLHAVLFVLQKIVEFKNQFREFVMVLFFGDLVAQDSHALSFLRCHLGLTTTALGILVLEGRTKSKPEKPELVALEIVEGSGRNGEIL